jgi:hypothetical protein
VLVVVRFADHDNVRWQVLDRFAETNWRVEASETEEPAVLDRHAPTAIYEEAPHEVEPHVGRFRLLPASPSIPELTPEIDQLQHYCENLANDLQPI